MIFGMVYKSGQVFLFLSQFTRVTDRRTDRQTDRQTEFSSLDRVCISCSAVKLRTSRDPAIQNPPKTAKMGKFTIKLYAIFYAIITNRNNVIKLRILYKHENVVFSQLLDCENQKSLNSTQVMTYNHDRHEILRKVGLSFSHCHLHSVCRSTPGTGHTSLCNICDKSPRFYCSCSLFAQHSCDVFEKRYIQDLHCDVRPGDDVRFPG